MKKLFEFWCEVTPTPGLERGTSSRSGGPAVPAGVIVESFPEGFRDQEVLTGIPSFAFPCDTTRCVCGRGLQADAPIGFMYDSCGI